MIRPSDGLRIGEGISSLLFHSLFFFTLTVTTPQHFGDRMASQGIRSRARPASDLQGPNAGLDEIDQDSSLKDSYLKGHPPQISKKNSSSRGAILALSVAGLLVALFAAKTLYYPSFGSRGPLSSSSGKRAPQHDMTRLPNRSFPVDEKFLLMDYSPWLGFNNMRYRVASALASTSCCLLAI